MTKVSYSARVKKYLTERSAQEMGFVKAGREKKISRCCAKAFLSGAVLFSKKVRDKYSTISVETSDFSELITYLFIHVLKYEPRVELKSTRGRDVFEIGLDEEMRDRFASFSDLSEYISCPSCFSYFLRGAFIAAGTVTDPKISYHAEFVVGNEELAKSLFSLLLVENKDARLIERGSNFVVYIKGNERISDLFAEIGAQPYALDVIEKSVEKEMKNSLNRRCNCENANMGKTVSASVDTRAAIEKIKSHGAWNTLSGELRAAAELRIKYPDASLSELCALAEGESISRSGLNHRLRKICNIAKEIEN